jgi:hypothetical protein
MKFLRLVIFFVLSLALPSLGLAAVGTASQCPMQSAGHSAMQMAQMDCTGCGDTGLDTKLKPHGPCKMDTACNACTPSLPPIAQNSVKPLHASQIVLAHPNTPVFYYDPDGLWRPPQL